MSQWAGSSEEQGAWATVQKCWGTGLFLGSSPIHSFIHIRGCPVREPLCPHGGTTVSRKAWLRPSWSSELRGPSGNQLDPHRSKCSVSCGQGCEGQDVAPFGVRLREAFPSSGWKGENTTEGGGSHPVTQMARMESQAPIQVRWQQACGRAAWAGGMPTTSWSWEKGQATETLLPS